MTDSQGAPLRAHVVLLAGPCGSGKTHLAQRSGPPLLDLDHFCKDGDDPSAPRHPTLGIVDWDDQRSWDADGALAAIEAICRDGAAEVPIYGIAQDGRVGTRRFDVGHHAAFVGTGIVAAELVQAALGARPCDRAGTLAALRSADAGHQPSSAPCAGRAEVRARSPSPG